MAYTIVRKKIYRTKDFLNEKSFFEGLKLIYNGFMYNIFGKHIMGNRSGGEEKYCKIYSNDVDDDDDYYDDKLYTPKEVTPRDEILDPNIKEMFKDEK